VLSSQWEEFYATQLGLRRDRIRIMVNPTTPPSPVPDRSRRDSVQFLFLGRINDAKGAFELLDAYRALSATSRTAARIVFAGDGRVEELRRRAAEIGPDVVVHSWLDREECDHLLAASDVLVLPSHHEGVPMAILEAMAYGLPVIATPVGGIPDVIRHGREGLLVEVGNRAALTAALARMVAEPALRMSLGREARATAESLDVTNYGQRLLEFYQTITADTSDALDLTEIGAETGPMAYRRLSSLGAIPSPPTARWAKLVARMGQKTLIVCAPATRPSTRASAPPSQRGHSHVSGNGP